MRWGFSGGVHCLPPHSELHAQASAMAQKALSHLPPPSLHLASCCCQLTRLTPALPGPLAVCFRHMSQSLQGLCIHGPSGWHVPLSTVPKPHTPELRGSFLHIIWGLSRAQEASSLILQPLVPLYFLSQHPLPPALTSRIFAQCPSFPPRTSCKGFSCMLHKC